MESPVKKLDFGVANKENEPHKNIDNTQLKTKIVEETKEETKTVVTAKTEELDEPLLQENPQRFVLFPIKYHEVCDVPLRVLTRKVPPSPPHTRTSH
jgi:ribonucleoside-diphosphate reductase subunit M2